MKKEVYEIDVITWIRINKTQARHLYDGGKVIGLCSVNVNPLSAWGLIVDACKNDEKFYDFDSLVNSFVYYNCQYPETGLYPKFFMKRG